MRSIRRDSESRENGPRLRGLRIGPFIVTGGRFSRGSPASRPTDSRAGAAPVTVEKDASFVTQTDKAHPPMATGRAGGLVGYDTALTWRRSPVRLRAGPSLAPDFQGSAVA